ncbi:malate synthase [Ureibacillus massiliensis 4400831 = CIP 108448 = CCUG 49529]|uniref:Malate synthase n=1 Tax=Ureibacillus massiliensis 4400831 = CIP 108448 = CCUG 49529 TaxID=1211035 RepID=A0A0A3J3M2_9BACL|nr:malate synthase A [Ureibacillus massiliensis]KGR89763.1 malate synthase [Ureibacillus massiliensis 4400831 = CIP 108448 = CCUG 49529]
MEQTISEKLNITGKLTDEAKEILTPEALEFIVSLHEKFNERRKVLLNKRQERQKRLDNGERLNFLEETKEIREGNWTIAPLPDDLKDRRVEITGPAVDRKMVINALNSGAKMFMACFEDASTPTWENMIAGQINMRDSIRKTIAFTQPETGKQYSLKDHTAILLVRPRGLHLLEKNVLVNGEPMSGSFFDFGLYFFHNAKEALAQGTGPYFYLPKLESHLEARLWNDVFIYAQDYLGIPQGTIKATVLIETILAAFEMDEILYELRQHSAGLNCGRWDYIFSFIKRLRNQPDVILPDRGQVTMTVPFMRAYTSLCIQTCHKRNAPAIGGMAAQIPVKDDEKANEIAYEKVREDKRREATDGHDGTWVAHPGLVPVAMEQFDAVMKTPNQIDKKREDVQVTAEDLLAVPEGTITEEGLRVNVSVGIQYIASWLRGNGAAPINNLMEDAATAEISRTQVWQWIRHEKGILIDGRKVTLELVLQIVEEELAKIKNAVGEQAYNSGKYRDAAELFKYLIEQEEFIEFLTLPGYEKIS